MRALSGVGDVLAGEWHEKGLDGRTVHVKRRVRESEFPNILVDVRGTDEGARRIAAVRAATPDRIHHMIGDW